MGGGVDVHDESQLYVEDSIFLDNNAKFYGAGISCLFSSLQVLQTHFERNNCDFDGGVIHSIFSTIDIGTSTFTLNHGLSGGALSCTSNSSCLSSNNRYESNSVCFHSFAFFSHLLG